MFITKFNSKQKQLKMVQEIQHRQSDTVQLASARSFTRGGELATKSNSRGEEGYSPKANKTG